MPPPPPLYNAPCLIVSNLASPSGVLSSLSLRTNARAPGVLWDGLFPNGLERGEYGLSDEDVSTPMSKMSGVVSRKRLSFGEQFSSLTPSLQKGSKRPIRFARANPLFSMHRERDHARCSSSAGIKPRWQLNDLFIKHLIILEGNVKMGTKTK